MTTTQIHDTHREWAAGRAAADAAPELCSTLTMAFLDDPVFRWWIPSDRRRVEILPLFFRVIAEMYAPAGEIWAVRDSVAVAVWSPPAGGPGEEEWAAAEPELVRASAEHAPRLLEVLEMLGERHPTDPHWYLFFLATRPMFQSRGAGSALLRQVLDECDRTGMPAYLEASSERSRELYLRHGFRDSGLITLPDGPPMWPMWRDPGA